MERKLSFKLNKIVNFTEIKSNESIQELIEFNPLLRKLFDNIENYFKEEYGRKLDFNPIKSKEIFHSNYSMHDIAFDYIVDLIYQSNSIPISLGKNLRDKKVQMENEIPDLLVLKEKIVFSLDVKAKSSIDWFGKINKRAVVGYRRFRDNVSLKEFQIPIYAQFVLLNNNTPTGTIGYSNISEVHLSDNCEWDKNITYKFNWKIGSSF